MVLCEDMEPDTQQTLLLATEAHNAFVNSVISDSPMSHDSVFNFRSKDTSSKLLCVAV